jgi:sugar phosphate isomerase/epimerase
MMIPGIWTGMYAEQPLHEALRTLHDEGWTAFEASTEHLEQIELDADPQARIAETRRCLADLALSMPQAHALLAANVADPDADKRVGETARLLRHIEIAAELGVQNVVIHPGRSDEDATRAGRQRTRALNVAAFRRLGDAAGERGMRIGLENLMRRGLGWPCELLDLLEAIDHPAIGITLDTSHANVVGLDLPAAIREFAPYLLATHISDNDGSGDQHRTPGNGQIEWQSTMRALRDVDYAGLFNLEIPGERHAVLALRALKSRFACQVAEWMVS